MVKMLNQVGPKRLRHCQHLPLWDNLPMFPVTRLGRRRQPDSCTLLQGKDLIVHRLPVLHTWPESVCSSNSPLLHGSPARAVENLSVGIAGSVPLTSHTRTHLFTNKACFTASFRLKVKSTVKNN